MPGKILAASALLLCWLAQSVPAPADEEHVNLVKNGSFEAGIDFNFSMGRWSIDGLPSTRLDDTTKVHGSYSLKLPFSRTAMLTKPAQYEGVRFRSAVPIMVARGRSYNFSIYLRADADKHGEIMITPNSPSEHRGAPIARKQIEVGRMWRRMGLTFTSSSDGNVYWQINVSSDEPGFLWVDAIQLEQEGFSEFRPQATVEVGLTSTKLGMIYAPDEPVVLTLTAYNDSTAGMTDFPFNVEVYDLDGQKVLSTSLMRTLPSKGGVKADITLPVKRHGLYRCVLSSPSLPSLKSELHFSVLPRPRPVSAQQSAFGAYLTIAPEPLKIAKRLGFRWIAHLTSNGRLYAWNNVEPKEGEFLWYDEDVALAKREGYQMMFNLEPRKVPKWALGLNDEERLIKWKNYVSAMVSHYRSDAVRYWTISDEAHAKEKYWPRTQDYAKWHQAGYEAIKASDPEAKVIINATADYARDAFQAMLPNYVDVLAGNFYYIPPAVEQMRQLASRYGIQEVWTPGVGDWMLPYYKQHLSQEQIKMVGDHYWATKTVALAKNVVMNFAHGSKRLFHYTATYVGNTNNFSVFEADSGLKPNAAQFSALIWLLDGFNRATEVVTNLIEKKIRVYRFDRNDGISVFAFWGASSDAQEITLPDIHKFSEIKMYDHFANPVDIGVVGSSMVINLGRYPAFLMIPQRLADRIEKPFKSASLRLSHLPVAKSITIAGRYAKVEGLDDGVNRYHRNLSFWYNSDTLGWIEIVRERSSDYPADYLMDDSGITVNWDFIRRSETFHIELGQFPADLAKGAKYAAYLTHNGKKKWSADNTCADETGPRRQQNHLTQEGSLKSPYGFVLYLRNGLVVIVETELMDEAMKLSMQSQQPGAWSVIKQDHTCFLHAYYPAGQSGRIGVRSRLSVMESARVRGTPLARVN